MPNTPTVKEVREYLSTFKDDDKVTVRFQAMEIVVEVTGEPTPEPAIEPAPEAEPVVEPQEEKKTE